MLTAAVLLLLTFVTMLPAAAQRKTAILCIGNSYTEDMLWRVPELLGNDTASVDLNFLYISGGALSDQAALMKNDKPNYIRFHFDNGSGQWLKDTTSYSVAIQAHDWDVITLQQCSQYSGNYSTIDHYLPSVLKYLQPDCPDADYYWHFTWAYPTDSQHPGFADYDHSQKKMYHDILYSTEKVMKGRFHDVFTGFIPTGAVIQELRDSTAIVTDHDFCRDDQHLDKTIGRYAAACTFYEAVLAPRLGTSVLDIDFQPADDSLRTTADYLQVREIVSQLVGNDSIIWSQLIDDHIYKSRFFEIRGAYLGFNPVRIPYIRQDFYESGRKRSNILMKLEE